VMATYLVAYGLYPERQNPRLVEMLEAYGTRWQMQRSVWIVVTNQTAVQVASNLKACLDDKDYLFVGELTSNSAWGGYAPGISKWLGKYLSGSRS
jgi:CRISPR/Cas system-associated endoribonuclease Cas2